MKKLVSILSICLISVLSFAQDGTSAAELKNAGNEALRAKNYKAALEAYQKYVATGEEGVAEDSKTVYNMATCARKLKDYDKAFEYLNKTIEMGYKPDAATYYVGSIYKTQGKSEEAIKVYTEALEKYPNSRFAVNFKKQLSTLMNKQAASIFNEANEIAQKASGKTDPAAYLSIMKSAVVKFYEAKDAFKKVLAVNDTDQVAKSNISKIDAAIKAYEDYKASLKN